MDTKESNVKSELAPPLCLSLWSVRRRMRVKPIETVPLIKEWGFSTVELAGFFHLDPSMLANALRAQGLRVCSMHAPPLSPKRDADHYCDWADQYLSLFDARELVLHSSDQSFPTAAEGDSPNECDEVRHRLAELIVRIAERVEASDRLVSYHCFTHDFRSVGTESLVSRLLARGDLPANFAFQLDTYWLDHAGLDPNVYASWPVHSVHLNERDSEGNCCRLGTDENKCVKYIRPLVWRCPPVNWILENDGSDVHDFPNDNDMIDIVKECAQRWQGFWQSITSSDSVDVSRGNS